MTTSPAIEVLQRELALIGQAVEKLSDDLKQASAKQKSLREAVQLLEGQPIQAPRILPNGKRVNLRDQILGMLLPDGMGLTAPEIAKSLADVGRETGTTTVSSTLSRLKSDGLAVKARGRWYGVAHQINDENVSSTSGNAVSVVTLQLKENAANAVAAEAKTGSAHNTPGFHNPQSSPAGALD